MSASYILFDRDGTLIKHIPYLVDPDQVEFLPNVIEGMKLMKGLGFEFGVITNQSVIGRGLATRLEVDRVNARVVSLLKAESIAISFILMCPHQPSEMCSCRKPSLGLGIIAIEEFGLSPSTSFMIGDAASDISFGQGIGCHTIQIIERPEIASSADYATIDLLGAAKYIHSQIERA